MARDFFDNLDPCGFEQLTSMNSAKPLATPTGTASGKTARIALISVEVANVRFRDDGTAPTAAIGLRILKDSAPFWYVGDLKALQFIDEGAGNTAKVNVGYYR